jgi:hypothetical protein
LKFEQEVREKLKLKKNLLKELEKDQDPVIFNEWVPTGPIISCNGCGKTFSDKSGKQGGSERVGAAVSFFTKFNFFFNREDRKDYAATVVTTRRTN